MILFVQNRNDKPSIASVLAVAVLVGSLTGCATVNRWLGRTPEPANTSATNEQPAKGAELVPTPVVKKQAVAAQKSSGRSKRESAAIKASAEPFSGYLVDYRDMEEMKTATGGTSLRWISPDLEKGQYKAIIIDPVGFYPKPPLYSKVSKGNMLLAVQHLQKQAQAEIGRNLKVVSQPGPGVLRWDAAITAVKASKHTEDCESNLPVAMIFTDLSPTAASEQAQSDLVVFLESQLIDTQTNKVVARSVRAGVGNPLLVKNSKVTFKEMQPVLDNWVRDGSTFVSEYIK